MKARIYICIILIVAANIGHANCNLINDNVKQIMLKNQINGVAIAIISPGNTEFCNYGYTTATKKDKVTKHTIFEIASISKTFTATLAGIAASRGLLNLQRPINQYVTSLNGVTIYNDVNSQELLTHVSGLNFTQETNFNQSSVDFIRALNKTQAQHLPQTYYQYGQVGISLVAIALEEIYKLPFKKILQQQLLDKIGMNETFIYPPSNYKDIATGYNTNNQAVPMFSTDILTPSAGLKSSSQDMAKYIKVQLDSSHYPSLTKALSFVHKNYYCLYQDGTYQQLAWEYHPRGDLLSIFQPNINTNTSSISRELAKSCANNSNGFIEKSGNSPGMSSYIIYMPSADTGVVVLTNKALVPDSVNLGRSILKKISPQI